MKNLISRQILFLGFCFIIATQLISCDEIWVDEHYDSYSDYYYDEYVEDVVVEVVHVSDENDPSGGLDYWPSSYKGSFRDFHGTYKLDKYNSTCTDTGYGDPCLELPTYLYTYTYDDMMDFETSSSLLVWNASIYSDDTFGFDTNYLDYYGYPSVEFPCSCAFYDGSDRQEVIECSCNPTNALKSCKFYYDLN